MSSILQDKSLSWKAKALFMFLASHGESGVFSEAQIIHASRDGASAVRAGIKELEARGYMSRSQERNDEGQLGTARYVLNLHPQESER